MPSAIANLVPALGDVPAWVLVCVAFSAAVAVYQAFFAIHYPSNLPLAGEPPGRRWFSLRTRWRYMTDCASLYREVYENVSALLLTTVVSHRDVWLIRHCSFRNMAKQC